MNKALHLRKITLGDSEVLLNWRNDSVTRRNSHTPSSVDVDEHQAYLNKTINSSQRSQFILEYNGVPVGTISEDKWGDQEFKLSYTVSPSFRGKKIGQIMMNIYLLERIGIFFCEIKEENTPSIKMVKNLGFKFFSNKDGLDLYQLNRLPELK